MTNLSDIEIMIDGNEPTSIVNIFFKDNYTLTYNHLLKMFYEDGTNETVRFETQSKVESNKLDKFITWYNKNKNN